MQVGLEKSLVNARMIYEILDMPPRQRDVPDAKPVVVSKGEVRFEDVHFAYSEEFPILHGVSFRGGGRQDDSDRRGLRRR